MIHQKMNFLRALTIILALILVLSGRDGVSAKPKTEDVAGSSRNSETSVIGSNKTSPAAGATIPMTSHNKKKENGLF